MSNHSTFGVLIAFVAAIVVAPAALCAAPFDLQVQIEGLDGRGWLTDQTSFCPPGGPADRSPGVSWTHGPQGTRSYVLLMTDPDVPKDLSLINKPGAVIADEAPRMRVFHWVLADIPPEVTFLAPALESNGVQPHGKPIGRTSHGLRGANDYTTFLSSIEGMAGTYGGYDGPCPPANDVRPHHYTVRVVALDVRTLGLDGAFTGEQVEKAMLGHVLAEGRATAVYALNPALRASP